MKIVLFTENLPNYTSGGRWYPMHLAYALAHAGHNVTIFTNNEPKFLIEFDKYPAKCKVVIDDKFGSTDIDQFAGTDLFIGSPIRGADYAVVMAEIHKAKSVVICYEPHNWIIESNRNDIQINNHYWVDYKKQSLKCDMFLCNAELPAEYARKWLPEIKNKVRYLYNGINTITADTVNRIPMDEREHAVAFVSRITNDAKYKGWERLWDVLGYMEGEKPKVYIVAGYCPKTEKELITTKCKERGIEVEFALNCSDKKKYNILAKVKALFFPSLFEGFGLPPAESLYVGTPVIAYGLKIFKEIYGNSLHYLTPGDFAGARKTVSELLRDNQTLFKGISAAQAAITQWCTFEAFSEAADRLMNSMFELEAATIPIVEVKAAKPKRVIEKKVSIVVPIYNVDNGYLTECFSSLLSQSHIDLEYVIVNDGITNEHNLNFLKKYRKDKRFVFVDHKENCGIAAAVTSGINVASGEYIALVDSDDKLKSNAVEVLLYEILAKEADFGYSNEARFVGQNQVEVKKPAWSHEFLMQSQYINHMTMWKSEFIKELMPCLEQYGGSWDYDLLLRASEKNPIVAHVARVLYYWRQHQNQYGLMNAYSAQMDAKKAIEDHIKRIGKDEYLDIYLTSVLGYFEHRHKIVGKEPKVLIITMTRNVHLLGQLLISIDNNTEYKNYEIVVISHVPNGVTDLPVKNYVEKRGDIYMEQEGEFNFSTFNNAAFKQYGGDSDYVVIINDDIVVHRGWLRELIATFQYTGEETGVVGAKLLFLNHDDPRFVHFPVNWMDACATIQHAGVPLLKDQRASHIYCNRPSCHLAANYIREWPAVTFGLVAIDAECYGSVKLNPKYDSDLNDMEFCIRAKRKGWNTFYTPWALAFHHNSVTRKKVGNAGKKINHHEFQQEYQKVLDKHMLHREMIRMEKEGI